MLHRQESTAMVDRYNQQLDPLMKTTAFTSTASAFEEARSLAYRISAVVDRLCGVQPSGASGVCEQPGAGSVLGSLRDDADQTVDAVRRAMMQLDRLERELP